MAAEWPQDLLTPENPRKGAGVTMTHRGLREITSNQLIKIVSIQSIVLKK